MTEYRNVIDKSAWPRGPWDHEPDKVTWVDPATGLDCMINRGPVGAWCGYVGVPPEHPWHGKDYMQCTLPEPCADWCDDRYCEHRPDVSIHGGLTYADACQDTADESRGICHVPEPGRPHDVWWLGFDCAHLHDLAPAMERYGSYGGDVYRDEAYVRAEVLSLARQLAEVAS
jgi:hypothetical protein